MLRKHRIAERKRRRCRRMIENSIIPSANTSLEVSKDPQEKLSSDLSHFEEADVNKILKCEANFFCEVLCRLSKEIKCTRNLDNLGNIISLASEFLHASAAKEKAIASQIDASNGISSSEKSCLDDIFHIDGAIDEKEVAKLKSLFEKESD